MHRMKRFFTLFVDIFRGTTDAVRSASREDKQIRPQRTWSCQPCCVHHTQCRWRGVRHYPRGIRNSISAHTACRNSQYNQPVGKIQGDGRKFLDRFKSHLGSQISSQSLNEVHIYRLQPKSGTKGDFFHHIFLSLIVRSRRHGLQMANEADEVLLGKRPR